MPSAGTAGSFRSRVARQRVLVVFVDALGPRQLERFGRRLDSLPHRRQLEGILGYTSGALPTILTGASPRMHGRMCLFTERKKGEPHLLAPLSWLGLLPRLVHERRRVRRVVERWLTSKHGLTGYVALHKVPPEHFRWLAIPEHDDLFGAPDIGGARTFLADAREAGISVYASPWQTPEPRRWEEAHAVLEAEPPDLAFLYSAELDALLHLEGNDGPKARRAAERISENVERARHAMARGNADVVTFVVGDHGMADIRATIDPRALLRRLGGTRAFADSTMLRLWGNPGELERARDCLEATRWPGTWMNLAKLRESQVPTKNAPYGNAFFVLDEGLMFAPSFLGGAAAGMHGYGLASPSCFAALASDCPLPGDVRSLTDVAPLVRAALGLPAASAAASADLAVPSESSVLIDPLSIN